MKKIDNNTYEIAGETITVGGRRPIQPWSEEYKWAQDMMKLSEEALLKKYKEKVKTPKEEDQLFFDCKKCERCRGTGKDVVCHNCGGEKKVKCEKCKGHGQFKNCLACDSTGKVKCHNCHGLQKAKCYRCKGTGKDKKCTVCDGEGKVEKTRLVNCPKCHGSGRDQSNYKLNCWDCRGTGQIEQKYKDLCPNCNGLGFYGETCRNCDGTGRAECLDCDDGLETCSRCDGTGHAKCSACEGSGKVKCKTCGGKGKLDKCPDCERREHEREESFKWKSAILMCVDDKLSMADETSSRKEKTISVFNTKNISQRRKRFMLLGLFLGFLGVHLAYAKRWYLFILLWMSLIGGCVSGAGSDESVREELNKEERSALQITDEARKIVGETEKADPLPNVWNSIVAILWIGGALFIKKDGKGKKL